MALPQPKGKQLEVLDLKPEGHNVVLGTAGSGKTTLAIYRAIYLATLDDKEKVMLVTFNTTLVKYLEAIVGSEIPRNIEVRNYHKFARGYLISTSFASTVSARQDYIFDSMQLWTKRSQAENGFITLESIPTCSLDVLFILGHNSEVEHYLATHLASIHEANIVIITCSACTNLYAVKKSRKNIYLTRQEDNNTAELLLGTKFGFTFDLTKSELIFYNNIHLGDIITRLNNAFTKIN